MYVSYIGIKNPEDLEKVKAFIEEQGIEADVESSALLLTHRNEAKFRLTDMLVDEKIYDKDGNEVEVTEEICKELADEFYHDDYVYDGEAIQDITDNFLQSKGWEIR